MYSFGKTNLKNHFFWKIMFLKSNFQHNFSANSYKQVYPTEKHLTIEVSFESDFLRFFESMHFTRNLKIMKSINLKLIYVLLFILD